jgi:hypothetical protein
MAAKGGRDDKVDAFMETVLRPLKTGEFGANVFVSHSIRYPFIYRGHYLTGRCPKADSRHKVSRMAAEYNLPIDIANSGVGGLGLPAFN